MRAEIRASIQTKRMSMIDPGRTGTGTKFSQEAWKLPRSPKAIVAARRSQEQIADHVDLRRARMPA
jgi:hypothetical protein